MDSDIELLDRIESGEDKAFDMLVERYREMVYLLAYRMAGHLGELRDARAGTTAGGMLRQADGALQILLDAGAIGPAEGMELIRAMESLPEADPTRSIETFATEVEDARGRLAGLKQ